MLLYLCLYYTTTIPIILSSYHAFTSTRVGVPARSVTQMGFRDRLTKESFPRTVLYLHGISDINASRLLKFILFKGKR